MIITKQTVAEKIAAYLHHAITLEQLVDWAENAMMEGEFDERDMDALRGVMARRGVGGAESAHRADRRDAFQLAQAGCRKGARGILHQGRRDYPGEFERSGAACNQVVRRGGRLASADIDQRADRGRDLLRHQRSR